MVMQRGQEVPNEILRNKMRQLDTTAKRMASMLGIRYAPGTMANELETLITDRKIIVKSKDAEDGYVEPEASGEDLFNQPQKGRKRKGQ